MARGSGMSKTRRKRPAKPAVPQGPSFTEIMKERLGWRSDPDAQPFWTTANRKCGGCFRIKSGTEFDCPATPGRSDLNVCRACAADASRRA